MINFGNTWHLNEAETSRNDWWWEKIIRQMSRVLLGDWGAGPSRLSYIHSRWEWKAFVGSWGWSTYGHRETRFSSCFSGFGSTTTSGQLMLTFNDLSENPRQSWPCFSMRSEKCKFILPYMSFVQKWPLYSEPFQKSHWLLPSKRRKTEMGKSQTPFNTLQKGLWRQRLKWEVMQIYPHPQHNCFRTLSSRCFFFLSLLFFFFFSSVAELENVNDWRLVTSTG